ncbi:MAG: glutamate--cysteine ligase [Alphaproteobacteria bacterium]
MTAMPSSNTTAVTHPDDLASYLASGCKPADAWAIGTEHEKFPYRTTTHSPIPYEGPNGIRALLEGLSRRFGWQPIFEGEHVIALTKGGAAISLEPAGQLELSGAPLKTLHETSEELDQHISEVKAVAKDLDIAFLCLGFHPTWRREECPWMPKQRYGIMRAYMPQRGSLGLDMMLRTTTIQVNLDFSSEADMVDKFRAGLFLQPLANALFANSGHGEGTINGYASYRARIWQDTDPDRCGFLKFVFEDTMGFSAYVDYMLRVPMYFVYRKGRYIDVAGQRFGDFMKGALPGLPGERPTLADWADHLSTAFPEVRLKKFLEMRGADGGLPDRIKALPAFWVGLLYDAVALKTVLSWLDEVSLEDIASAHQNGPRQGLMTPMGPYTLKEWGERAVALSAEGLKRRARMNAQQHSEVIYLTPLFDILNHGQSPGQRNVALYGNNVISLIRDATL